MSNPEDGAVSRDQVLNEQLKRLVRSERKLYLSQRALERQLWRLHQLNHYAIAAGAASHPHEILELALELLMKLFPLEQGVALLQVDERLQPVAVRAVEGMEGESLSRLPLAPPLAVPARALGTQPRVQKLSEPMDEAASALGGCVAGLFREAEEGPEPPGATVLILPLWQRADAPAGALVLRRLTALLPFHQALPSEQDRDFLEVTCKQIAGAVTNAVLVEDVRRSYERLAAAQADLVRKERLAAVGELAAQMAHEVRNPLGAIANSISGLQRLCAGGEEVRILLDILGEETGRLDRIVEDLLDFSRPSAPSLRPERIDEVIRSALEGAERAVRLQDVEVRIDRVGELPPVPMDARMVRQAILNLMVNAVQAMSGRGRLWIRLSTEGEGPSSRVRVDLSDTGPGIPPEVADRLFQPFFTTRASGTGLGLAVVRRFIEAHGGETSFETAPGRGSTFTLRLPLAPDASKDGDARPDGLKETATGPSLRDARLSG